MFLAARPTYKPNSVTTTVEIDDTLGKSGQMVAKCHFEDNPMDPGSLLYQVTWFFDNVFGVTSGTVSYNNITQTDIILNETNIKTLGKKVGLLTHYHSQLKHRASLFLKILQDVYHVLYQVSCSVVAKTLDKSPPGPAATSDQVFLGIEVC